MMPKKRFKATVLLPLLMLMCISTSVVANADGEHKIPVMNQWGMTAPFLLSWLPIWIFSIMGGIGSLFIKIDKIDANFRHLYIAKPFLGLFGALSMCLVVASGCEPPEVALSAYAFIAAFASAPLLQGLLTLVSSAKNQIAIINKVSPVQFEVDKGDKS